MNTKPVTHYIYSTPFGTRTTATLQDALDYAGMAWDASGYRTAIWDNNGKTISYRFTSSSKAVL